MSLKERHQKLIDLFSSLNTWEEKYKEILRFGKELPPMDEAHKVEKYQVKGCQSQVWLFPEFKDGKVFFEGESDALISKGIIALLIHAFSNADPDEIVNSNADFLTEIGIKEHLSMNRSNGLTSMLKQIKMYAIVYKSMLPS